MTDDCRPEAKAVDNYIRLREAADKANKELKEAEAELDRFGIKMSLTTEYELPIVTNQEVLPVEPLLRSATRTDTNRLTQQAKAMGYQMYKKGYSQAKIARTLKVTQPTVAYHIKRNWSKDQI